MYMYETNPIVGLGNRSIQKISEPTARQLISDANEDSTGPAWPCILQSLSAYLGI